MTEEKCYVVKIIIIGNQSVGKTNIVTRYVKGEFSEDYMITIGMDFLTCNLKSDDKIFKLRLWDTAGSEKFRSITKGYYSNTCCALIVYDITNQNSFDSVKHWIEDVKNYADKDTHLVLVGNKIDLKDQRKISKEDGQNLATQNGMDFYESSALTGENINNIFEGICKYVNQKIDEGKIDLNDPSNGISVSEIEEGMKIHKTMSFAENANIILQVPKKKKCGC
jgi:small GTP-binding protein